MPKKRFSPPPGKPAIYHCVSRAVNDRFIFEDPERAVFGGFLRMYETYSGCRVLTYCIMSNHIHLLIEVPPASASPLSDRELVDRVKAIATEDTTHALRGELKEARRRLAEGTLGEDAIRGIHARHTARMHDLSDFIKPVLQRMTRWYNRTHKRRGVLWADLFRSTVVEPGLAARALAAYIDLNPVRAGLVRDPADFPWCGYGVAVREDHPHSKSARQGLVRAWTAHHDIPATEKHWHGKHDVASEYRAFLTRKGIENTRGIDDETTTRYREKLTADGTPATTIEAQLREIDAQRLHATAATLHSRIRHFSHGAAIGQRDFVNEIFTQNRTRFGPKRTEGARTIRGKAAPLTKIAGLWSLRDAGLSDGC